MNYCGHQENNVDKEIFLMDMLNRKKCRWIGGILKVDCSASTEKPSRCQDNSRWEYLWRACVVVSECLFLTTKMNISSMFCLPCASWVCACVLFKHEIISAWQHVQLKHAIAIAQVCALYLDQSTRWFFLKCIISSALRSLPSG